MKKLLTILPALLWFSLSFGQSVPDNIRTLPTPATGANKNNKAQVDANLRVSLSFRIPSGPTETLNGAKDSIGYLFFNTTTNRLKVYRGSGVWDSYTTQADLGNYQPLLGYTAANDANVIHNNLTSTPESKRISLLDSIKTTGVVKSNRINVDSIRVNTPCFAPCNVPNNARDYWTIKESATRPGRLAFWYTNVNGTTGVAGNPREYHFVGSGGAWVMLPGYDTKNSHSGGLEIGDRSVSYQTMFGLYTNTQVFRIAQVSSVNNGGFYNFTPTYTTDIFTIDTLKKVSIKTGSSQFVTEGSDEYLTARSLNPLGKLYVQKADSLYEKLLNKVTTLASPNNNSYPTSKAVSDAIAAIPTGGGTVTSLTDNTANGVAITWANRTTTPTPTIVLGAITPSSIVASGTISGSNLSGTNTGDQTSVTGNAGTATTLQTTRTINGVSFNGSANVQNTTDQITEGTTNLYFTQGRVLATPLTGYALGTNTAVTATDNLLAMAGKFQAEINATNTALSGYWILSGNNASTGYNTLGFTTASGKTAQPYILDIGNGTGAYQYINTNGAGLLINPTLRPSQTGNYYGVFINPILGTGTTGVSALGTPSPNTGYINGVYDFTPTTSGSGVDATIHVTVAGGVITVITIPNMGLGYAIADNLIFTMNLFAGGTQVVTVPITGISPAVNAFALGVNGTMTANAITSPSITATTKFNSSVYGNLNGGDLSFSGAAIVGKFAISNESEFIVGLSSSDNARLNIAGTTYANSGPFQVPARALSMSSVNLMPSVDGDPLIAVDINPTYGTGSTTSVKTVNTVVTGTATSNQSSLIVNLSGGTGSGAKAKLTYTTGATTGTLVLLRGGSNYTVGDVLTITSGGLTFTSTIPAGGLGLSHSDFALRVNNNVNFNYTIPTSTNYTQVLVKDPTSGNMQKVDFSQIITQVVEISGTTQQASANTLYIPHNSAQTTITIPLEANAPIGTLVQVVGEGSGGWKVAQNASQQIVGVGGFATTAGTAGYIYSTDAACTVTLRKSLANKWTITSSQGTIQKN